MKLVDTHCHLDLPDYKDDLDMVVKRAVSGGVERMIVPGINIESSEQAVALADKYPEVFAAVGIHPHEADKVGPGTMARLKELGLNGRKVVAIGEVGLDYFKKLSGIDNQKKLLRSVIEVSRELDLPLILHDREADKDILEILTPLKETFSLKGVLHCFSGDAIFLKEILALGLYVSFTGVITFEKAGKVREIIKLVPPERLLLETDSPYMAPVPFRGKRNEPAFVRDLLKVYAEVYGLSVEDIARITTHNANHLFGLALEEIASIAYPIRDSLYINMTNRCTNRCTFCTRDVSSYVKGHKLVLSAEPTIDEVISAMGDISKYREIVFCGFGEPTTRLDVVKKVSAYAKERGKAVRLVTNGEGDLINSRRIAPELKGLIDIVSVSLNLPDAEKYDHVCRSVYGKEAFGAIISFVKDCRVEGIEVEMTALDFIGGEDVDECRKIADKFGAKFRLRHLNVVG